MALTELSFLLVMFCFRLPQTWGHMFILRVASISVINTDADNNQ